MSHLNSRFNLDSPRAPSTRDFAPLSRELLFIHKFKSDSFSGLKGLYIPAQGIVSGGTIRNAALGKRYKRKTVRAKMLNRKISLFRTE